MTVEQEVFLPPAEEYSPPREQPLPEEFSSDYHAPVRKRGRTAHRALLMYVSAAAALCVVAGYTFSPESLPQPDVPAQQEPVQTPEPPPPSQPSQPSVSVPSSSSSPGAEAVDVRAVLLEYGTWQDDSGQTVRFLEDGSGWWFDGKNFVRMSWEGDAEGVRFDADGAWETSSGGSDGEVGMTSGHASGDLTLQGDRQNGFSFSVAGPFEENGDFLPAPDAVIDDSALAALSGITVPELLTGRTWTAEGTEETDPGFLLPYPVSLTLAADGTGTVVFTDTKNTGTTAFPLTWTAEGSTVQLTTGTIVYAYQDPDGGNGTFESSLDGSCYLTLTQEGPCLRVINPYGWAWAKLK